MEGSADNSRGESKSGDRLILPVAILLSILILGNVLMPHSSHHRAPIKETITQMGAFSEALEMFKSDVGHYPADLSDLVVQPTGATTNWHQYFDKIWPDPWGHPYRYEYPGKHRTNSYDLSSAGPDGKFGTQDDIMNWDMPH